MPEAVAIVAAAVVESAAGAPSKGAASGKEGGRAKVRFGAATTHMPDFVSMTSVGGATRKQDTSNKPFDNDFFKNPFKENFDSPRNVNPGMTDFIDSKITQHAKMTREIESTLGNLSSAIGITGKRMIIEGDEDFEESIDLEISLDHDEDNE